MENWKELFKIHPCDTEEKEWCITIGNHLATTRRFKTPKEAQNAINSKDWDLIASMIFACNEMIEAEKANKEKQESENTTKEEEA